MTYPTLSTTYGETVCTAGIREDGSWIRLYPVPFRRLDEVERYKKFDWLECGVVRHKGDPRPESFRPTDDAELEPVAHVGTHNLWEERRRLLLEQGTVYDRLDELIASAKSNLASLAVFKPKRVLDFVIKPSDREWDLGKVRRIREATKQHDLFDDNTWRERFKFIPCLPYAFSYRFEDATGKESTLRILDWETGALFWNCLRAAGGKQSYEPAALKKVRQKYMDQFLKTDLHFFVGTTQQFHARAPNPWLIIGVFPIPVQRQLKLL